MHSRASLRDNIHFNFFEAYEAFNYARRKCDYFSRFVCVCLCVFCFVRTWLIMTLCGIDDKSPHVIGADRDTIVPARYIRHNVLYSWTQRKRVTLWAAFGLIIIIARGIIYYRLPWLLRPRRVPKIWPIPIFSDVDTRLDIKLVVLARLLSGNRFGDYSARSVRPRGLRDHVRVSFEKIRYAKTATLRALTEGR